MPGKSGGSFRANSRRVSDTPPGGPRYYTLDRPSTSGAFAPIDQSNCGQAAVRVEAGAIPMESGKGL